MITDLRDGDPVEMTLLCREFKVATTKSGQEYLALRLEDRSGGLSARVWDNVGQFSGDGSLAGQVVRVDGVVNSYKGELQIKVNDLQVIANADPSAYLTASRFDPQMLSAQLLESIKAHTSSPVRDIVLRAIQIAETFETSPAAKANHHAFASGLLEHTYSMVRLAATLGRHYSTYYPGLINTELLVAGTVLHDIGKVWELKKIEAGYTTVGELVGHIAMGAELVRRSMADLGIVDPDLAMQLAHMVLSHHGRREWGSPVEPKTPEAVLLHFLDQVDSRMGMVFEALEGVEPGQWSEKVWALGTKFYRAPKLDGGEDG